GSAPARSEEEKILDALNSAAMLDTHIALEDRAGSGSGGADADGSSPDGASESADDSTAGSGEELDAGADTSDPHGEIGVDELQEQSHGEAGGTEPKAGNAASPSQTGSAPTSSDIAVYPEWDCNLGEYRQQGATVRHMNPPQDSPAWVDQTLAEHSVLIRRVRRRFEMLRARRIQMPRQRDGDELDLAACVRALVDLRTGHSADDRLYVANRPARRDIAITILVDVSGSTADPVTDALSVIDVEKVALLLASEAIDALGDIYSILTFSSYGAADVRVTSLKDFREHNSDVVHRRISAIAPQGKTRLGAAVRHATAQLVSQPVGHRLLLILSDGRPNDTDRYFETYAAEDTRRAILEARALDVYPFCITVDGSDKAEEYLSHIFGAAGHTILRQPDQLPLALLKGVQQLLAS
ncbi:MAG TPA: VWA domain-containing protein, partial [Gemmatimonadaceae bacterium]